MGRADYVSIKYKTTISDMYFASEEDSERFDDWFIGVLTEVGLMGYSTVITPQGVPGVSKLEISVDSFDYTHYLEMRVLVDDGVYSYDELADNEVLLDYIDRVVAPDLIQAFDALLANVFLPMSNGTSFRNLKFDNEEFYCLLGYSEKYGFYPSGTIENTPFLVENDFEVYV